MPTDRGRGGSPARGGKPGGGKSGGPGSRGGKPAGGGAGKPARAPSAARPARPAAGPGTRFGPAMAGEGRAAAPRYSPGEGGPSRGKPSGGPKSGARSGGASPSGGGRAKSGGRGARGSAEPFERENDDWAVAGNRPRPAATGPTKAQVRVAAATAGAAPLVRTPRKPGGKPSGPRPTGPRAGSPRGDGPRPAPRPPYREPEAPFVGAPGTRPPRAPRPVEEAAVDAPATEIEAPREKDLIYGRHPAMAALKGDRPVNKVWLLKDLKNQTVVSEVKALAKAKGATVQIVERQKLDALSLDANHQGIVVSIAAADYVDLDEAITTAMAQKHPALLVLDGIEDPHNLGALVRTAEGAGFAAVVIPARRAVGLTPVVAKASAGAIDRLPVARVGNLAQALAALKKAGFLLVGADSEGEHLPYEVDMTQPLVLVIGGEGKGLGRLLAERCDHRVRLQLAGELESLNASVAGGVLMYEAVRQRWAAAPQP